MSETSLSNAASSTTTEHFNRAAAAQIGRASCRERV